MKPGNAHVEGRMRGAALKPLSGEQIKALVLLARKAFEQEVSGVGCQVSGEEDTSFDPAELEAPLPTTLLRSEASQGKHSHTHTLTHSSSATATSFDAWRHQHVMMTVERAGFRECVNEDFLPLKAHFLGLLGRTEEAERARVKHATEPRAWALKRFDEAVREANDAAFAANVRLDPIGYANGFLRKRAGVGLDEASVKQVWQCYYLLRRKAEGLRKQVVERESV